MDVQSLISFAYEDWAVYIVGINKNCSVSICSMFVDRQQSFIYYNHDFLIRRPNEETAFKQTQT